ncbi:MAG TPA: leucyl aminopeptidase, partial [bacterium]|nr:leucyl aminopeptidase [bacterium]
VNAAIMSNNSNLTKQLIRAGKLANERLWELPLDKEYYEQIKSPVADVKNSGGREGGSITAGAFLSKFIGNMTWAHLDIAGVAWEEKGKPYMDKGATGFGVRLLTQFVLDFEKPVKSE